MDPVRDGDPRRIGPYRLIGQLGSGGMGRVFLGRSRGGRAVAVKVVHAELAGDAEFRRRFAAEVEAARRVGGFYTAEVIDADADADPPWLATAYIPGPSLAEAVTGHGPLPSAAVRVLGAGLAEGLAAIHSTGLIHRDLTHRNVILADDGPRVIDFGIAKALDTVHLSTRVIGTPGFMSPEQARAGQIGPESDVFSLGCVLAYAATGTGPFGGGRADLVVYRVVHEEPDLGGVPADLAPLLRACLAKSPADRPRLDDVLDRLETPDAAATRWLPPDITAMITDRRTAIRTLTRPGDPGPPKPPARAPEPPGPSARHAGEAERPAAASEHDGGAATAAATLALLCLPGLLAMVFQAAALLLDPGPPVWLMLANVMVGVAEAVVLATGALLLFRRHAAGRWMIAVTGGAVALHGMSASMQYLLTGGRLTLETPVSVLIFVIAPLTALAAAGAMLMALLPSTGRWCLRRSRAEGPARQALGQRGGAMP
ncbi:serine/threonine-protein kinase [Nonomuraea angiospora]|uniref:serine/threonine-protein kinase n=1 Tax=Nonomuraea angiospora TaxID=46172 RepID=UPI0033DEE95B